MDPSVEEMYSGGLPPSFSMDTTCFESNFEDVAELLDLEESKEDFSRTAPGHITRKCICKPVQYCPKWKESSGLLESS